MTSLSSWLSPSSVRHGCPPYLTRVLLPYGILPLPRDVLLILLRFRHPVSGSLCMEVPLPCPGALTPHTRQLLPVDALCSLLGHLTSNAGHAPCVGTCVTLLNLYAGLLLTGWTLSSYPFESTSPCWVPSCGYHSSPALDHCGCFSPSVAVYLGFRLKLLIRKRGREKGSLIS